MQVVNWTAVLFDSNENVWTAMEISIVIRKSFKTIYKFKSQINISCPHIYLFDK